jgi:PadR family transcriptional regulator PadR
MAASDLDEVLNNWETVFRRGLLTFWILLLLEDHSSYPYEMNDEIGRLSQGTMSADGNSVYRALRRFERLGLVDSELRPSDTGPDRRYYALTEGGRRVLARFAGRNLAVFQQPAITERLGRLEDRFTRMERASHEVEA